LLQISGVITLLTISQWTGLKDKHFLNTFSDKNASWNDSFTGLIGGDCGFDYYSEVHWVRKTLALTTDYEGAPWTRKGHR
jgi:hypothetical protein